MSNTQTSFGMLPSSLIERPDLTVNEKFMLLVLSSFANREGECWPSIATLAERSGLSDRYVQMLCARLVELRLVAKERRGRRSNIYRLLWVSDVNARSANTYDEQSFASKGYDEQSFTSYDEQSFTQNLPIEQTIKDITSDREQEMLETVRSVPGYSSVFDPLKELSFLRDLVNDFPAVDVLAEVKKWKAYKLDVPLERNSRPHSQLRTWMGKVGTKPKPKTVSADEYNQRLFRETAL